MSRAPQGTKWCFTINVNVDINTAYEQLKKMAVDQPSFQLSFLVAQVEVAPTTGQVHIQGMVVFPSNWRFNRLVEVLQTAFEHHEDNNPIHPHVELMKSSVDANEAYCSKESTRAPGTDVVRVGTRPTNQQGKRSDLHRLCEELDSIDKTLPVQTRLRQLARNGANHASLVMYGRGFERLAELTAVTVSTPAPEAWRPWQSHMMSELSQPPHPRRIYWVYDPHGNSGKSFLASYYLGKEEACLLSGKLEDMKYAYANHAFPRIVFFDIPRSGSEHADHYYGMAESLKDGHLAVNKYQAKTCIFRPPHVVFLANHWPVASKWTGDRLRLLHLQEDGTFHVVNAPPDAPAPAPFVAVSSASGGNGPQSNVASSNVNPFAFIDLTQDSSDEEMDVDEI